MTLPSTGTVYVKLTATLAYGGETGSKTFLITVKSLKAQNDELVVLRSEEHTSELQSQ